MYSIYCSIKGKLAKGLWYALLERYGVYGWYIYLLLSGTAFSCTQEVQDVRSFFGKIYSPFCLQNCLFLFTAYFAKNSARKINFVKA